MKITTEDTKETKTIDFAVVKAIDLKKDPDLIFCLGGNDLEGRPTQTFWKDKNLMEVYRATKLEPIQSESIDRG